MQSLGVLASPRAGERYRPRKVVDFQQGKAMIVGSVEIGGPSQAGSIANGSQSTYPRLWYLEIANIWKEISYKKISGLS